MAEVMRGALRGVMRAPGDWIPLETDKAGVIVAFCTFQPDRRLPPAPPVVVECCCGMVERMSRLTLDRFKRGDLAEVRREGSRAAQVAIMAADSGREWALAIGCGDMQAITASSGVIETRQSRTTPILRRMEIASQA